MFASMFPMCPNCGKAEIPPGIAIVSYSLHGSQVFCDGEGGCAKMTCAGCGHMVNPLYHPLEECQSLRRLCDLRKCHDTPLRYEDVLEEAEMILRGGGYD